MASQHEYSPLYVSLLKLRAVSGDSENSPINLQDRLRDQKHSSIPIQPDNISIITTASDIITKKDKQSVHKGSVVSSGRRSKTSSYLDIGGKPTEESECMLDHSTLAQSSTIYMSFINKIRAFSSLRGNCMSSKSDISASYVVDSPENGPVCMLQDSPLRIFKVSSNQPFMEI